jgi:hypothetical protein
VQVPDGEVHAGVSDGWVTLDGEVQYQYQRHRGRDGARGGHGGEPSAGLSGAVRAAQVTLVERQAPPGQAVRLTRAEVKPAGVPDVIHVYGDTAVPWLADTPGFCETLLVADPGGGELISQTGWRDPAAQAASPSVGEMIRSDVLADDDCQIRAVEDYHVVFCSARKPGPA